MHPRLKYELDQWQPRALKRAKSLNGKQWTEREQEVIDAYAKHHDDQWATFMAFGIVPESQAYIDTTIKHLESNPDPPTLFVTTRIRLEWSCKALLANN